MRLGGGRFSKKKPHKMKVAISRLLALLLVLVGGFGLRQFSITRVYLATATFTISYPNQSGNVTDGELDSLVAEMTTAFPKAKVTRGKNQQSEIVTALSGETWNEMHQANIAYSKWLQKTATSRNLHMAGVFMNNHPFIPPDQRANRGIFLAAVAVTIFGAAMLLLSFRVLGGERREESPI